MFGGALQRRIDRGFDHDILVDTADVIVDRVHHPIGYIVERIRARRLHRAGGMVECESFCVLADQLLLRHIGEHDAGAACGAVRIMARCEPRWRLHQSGKKRSLGERQVSRRFSEIALRGGFDAIGAGAEIDAVQVKLKDLRFAEAVFEPERQRNFLQLA